MLPCDNTCKHGLQVRVLKESRHSGGSSPKTALDFILKRACKAGISPKQMVKTIFVFSDMQFDDAAKERHGQIPYHLAEAEFARHGYKLPLIVFWNVKSCDDPGFTSATFPVPSHQANTALVSGYSGHLLQLFMDKSALRQSGLLNAQPITSLNTMLSATARYEQWQVVD